MKIEFGDLKRDFAEVQDEVNETINRVLKSGWYILGEECAAFEKKFAQYLEIDYFVGCASGTEAIALSLMVNNIGPLDEVITTDLTAVPTISAITMAGAVPVLIDIDKDTCLLNIEKIEKHITKNTKAIIPVHLYGQCCDMDIIKEIAEKHGLIIIEDACQAHGSQYKTKKAGTIGHMGCFSFYPSKNLGCYGDGGGIAVSSKEMRDKLIMLRNYGQSKRYYHDVIGINSRLDEIQAAILQIKLKHLEKWNNRRSEIAKMYDSLIQNPAIEKLAIKNYNKPNYHLYIIKTDERDLFQKKLEEKNIFTFIHYPVPVHKQKSYNYLNYKDTDFENACSLSGRILSLPMYPQLKNEEVEYVCKTINNL